MYVGISTVYLVVYYHMVVIQQCHSHHTICVIMCYLY